MALIPGLVWQKSKALNPYTGLAHNQGPLAQDAEVEVEALTRDFLVEAEAPGLVWHKIEGLALIQGVVWLIIKGLWPLCKVWFGNKKAFEPYTRSGLAKPKAFSPYTSFDLAHNQGPLAQ